MTITPMFEGRSRYQLIGATVFVLALPFLIALATGEPVSGGSPAYWQFRLAEVFLLGIYAVSYNMLFGYTGILSLGHAAFFGVGAYLVAIGLRSFDLNLFLAFGLALLAVMVLGLLFGALTARLSGVHLAMMTLALAEVGFIIVKAPELVAYAGAEDGVRGVPVPAFISAADFRLRFYYLAFAFLVVTVLALRQLLQTPTGRGLIAVRENEARSEALGYNTLAYKVFGFTVAAVIGGFAGGLSALLNRGVSPGAMSLDFTSLAIIAVVIGGSGTLVGPIVGIAIVVLVQDFLRAELGGLWVVVYGIFGILVIMFAPAGVLGLLRREHDPQPRETEVLPGKAQESAVHPE